MSINRKSLQPITNNEKIYLTPPRSLKSSSIPTEIEKKNDSELESDTATNPTNGMCNVRKIQKKRLKSKSQLQILHEYYRHSKNPPQSKIEEIAKKVELSYYQVYKWFWEKRRCEKIERVKSSEIGIINQESSNSGFYVCTSINLPLSDPFTKRAAEILSELNPEIYYCKS